MAVVEDVERIVGEFPEVVEAERRGQVGWSVRGKVFAWLRSYSKADLKRFGDQVPPAEPILAVMTKDLHEKEGVLAAGIPGVFTIPHFDNYPAVLVEVGAIDEGDLRDLLVDAWLTRAPAELADRFDA